MTSLGLPDHRPRWEKSKITNTECIIPQCNDTFFSKCSIPHDDIVQCLKLAGENVPSNLAGVSLLQIAGAALNCCPATITGAAVIT